MTHPNAKQIGREQEVGDEWRLLVENFALNVETDEQVHVEQHSVGDFESVSHPSGGRVHQGVH
jgi:hypothetical protein